MSASIDKSVSTYTIRVLKYLEVFRYYNLLCYVFWKHYKVSAPVLFGLVIQGKLM